MSCPLSRCGLPSLRAMLSRYGLRWVWERMSSCDFGADVATAAGCLVVSMTAVSFSLLAVLFPIFCAHARIHSLSLPRLRLRGRSQSKSEPCANMRSGGSQQSLQISTTRDLIRIEKGIKQPTAPEEVGHGVGVYAWKRFGAVCLSLTFAIQSVVVSDNHALSDNLSVVLPRRPSLYISTCLRLHAHLVKS